MITKPGVPYPLGATVMDGGVNFAIYSDNAKAVTLCLFNSPDSPTESARIPLDERTENIFHAFLPGITAGQLYGYRVDGDYDPKRGFRFNPAKLMVDPYAKAITVKVDWSPELMPYLIAKAEDRDLTIDERDNAFAVPKAVVVDDRAFHWGNDKLVKRSWSETVIYEVHPAGFSKLWDAIPENQRGSYAAIGSKPAIDYFRKLGITAVELLPVHEHVDESTLEERGLSNYWGYNTLGFFAPHGAYSSSGTEGQQVTEFKQMVKNLHAAGLEVILDVVYNHTCEGNHFGPAFSFRGIDNPSYYRLMPDNPRYYRDYTGCGNTPDITHPRVLQLVMDSLRYWVQQMHVDGFRFDLASTLTREAHLPDMRGAFLDAMHQDPVLSRVKLIAEPWDVGEAGYLVGNFPILWSEWNGKFRDSIRRFWKSDGGLVAEIAYKLSGSPEYYQISGRRPYASVNFITAHDGFTLTDLVSYNEKHNLANGEENRDGDNNNLSWNCGVEGPTDDPQVNSLRDRQRRNFLVTLFLSQGVPMLNAGDEFGRTQNGNNNIYCQDNELGWFSWQRDAKANAIQRFTSRLIRFRHQHPVFRHTKFLNGRMIEEVGLKDVTWLHITGEEMTEAQWHDPHLRTLAMILCGDAPLLRGDDGERYRDGTFLLCFNASPEPASFKLAGPSGAFWKPVLDTASEEGFVPRARSVAVGDVVALIDHSLKVFQLER
ncbi:MAG TPA: glycogen debranching protein GlgX [Chthoniobacterales bacterium]